MNIFKSPITGRYDVGLSLDVYPASSVILNNFTTEREALIFAKQEFEKRFGIKPIASKRLTDSKIRI